MYCQKGDVVFVSVVAVVAFNTDDVVCCRAVNKASQSFYSAQRKLQLLWPISCYLLAILQLRIYKTLS